MPVNSSRKRNLLLGWKFWAVAALVAAAVVAVTGAFLVSGADAG